MYSKNSSNKKGYLFTWDVVLAIVLLSIGILVLFYNYSASTRDTYFTEKLSEDILGVLSYTKVSDLCTIGGSCPNYPKLEDLIASVQAADRDVNFDDDLLTFIAYLIETRIADGKDVKDLIHQIFVDNQVVDEKRFGFSVLYRTAAGDVLDIYNTETYS
ncbi:MAG TPA: hypothetical protein VK158_01235 [Acidobacteriota bacterium]|nr:hypothetical protein [Acidobacteriota bacterium]